MTLVLLVCGRKTEYDVARTLQIALKAQTLPATSLRSAIALLKTQKLDGVVIDDDGLLAKDEVKELILTSQEHNKKVPIVALCDSRDAGRAKVLRRFGCKSLVNPDRLIDDLPDSLRRCMS